MSEFTDLSAYDDGDGAGDIDWTDAGSATDDWTVTESTGEGYTGDTALVNAPDGADDILYWDGPDAAEDMEVVARFKSESYQDSTGLLRFAGVAARASGDDAYVAYSATQPTQGDGLTIARIESGSFTSIESEEGLVTLNEDDYYWIRFHVEGDELSARIWADGASEPESWQVETTDTNITGTGQPGLASKRDDNGPYHYDVLGAGFDGDSAPTEPIDQFVETFDPADDTNTPTDWTPQLNADGSEYTTRADAGALGGAYLEIDAENDDALTWDIPDDSGDVEVLAKHRYTDADSDGIGFVARFSNSGDDFVHWRTESTHEVITFVDDGFDDFASDSNIGADEGVWYLSRTRLSGDDFRYRIWADGTSEPPGWDFEETDLLSNVDSPGSIGIHDLNSGNIGELDWITVGVDGAEAPPPGEYVEITTTNNATDEEGNYIYRSDGVDPHALTEYTEIADLPPGAEGFIDDDLPEGSTTLHYAVTAYNGDIESPPVTESVVIEPDANTISGTSELGGEGVEATVFNINESTHEIVQTTGNINGSHLLDVEVGDHHVGAQFADENGEYQATSKPGVEVSDND